MQRCSDSIAALAAALAKAQCELTNPDKSLVGAIRAQAGDKGLGSRSARSGEGTERVFRYASLARGLDIVRKTLGQHEIATVQTTAIDQAAGTVKLTTVLAHASGQWISSDWPVCTIADAEEPHRMGAALSYARRYGLFTLVGIAGEDDLDAPDLIAPTGQDADQGNTLQRNGRGNAGTGNGHRHHPQAQRPSNRYLQAVPKPTLEPQRSASERERLLAELAPIDSADAAAIWAKRILPVKNQLTASDARFVEDAFQNKLSSFAETDPGLSTASASDGDVAGAQSSSSVALAPTMPSEGSTNGIDKAALAFPEPRRIRDKEHLRFVANQPCQICGRSPCDPHHLRFAQARALSRKVSDEFTVPLCRGHHRALHRFGDEAAWWKRAGIDPLPAARALWLTTRPIRNGASMTPTEAPTGGDGAVSEDNGAKPRRGRRPGASGKRRRNNETKPIVTDAQPRTHPV